MVRPQRKGKSQSSTSNPSHYRYKMIKTGADGRKMYKLEHRLILEDHLGRPLGRDERVIHLNGNIRDNRLENLELRKISANRVSKEHLIKSTLFTKGRPKTYDHVPLFYGIFNNNKVAKSI